MEAPASTLESRVEALESELGSLRGRVSQLETGRAPERAAPLLASAAPEPAGHLLEEVGARATSTVALVGRTLLELGGAYLLRALTDAQTLAPALGSALALAYAAVLLGLADREARREQRLGANFHGVTALVIAFPAIAEQAARLHVFSPVVAATLLVAFCAAGLAVAWHQSLAPVGWAATLGAVVGAFVVLRGTGEFPPVIATLFAVAIATEVLAFDDRWLGPRWLAALGADVGALLFASLVVREGGPPGIYAPTSEAFAVGAQLALPMLYVTSIGLRTIVRGRVIRAFAVLQGPVALVVGLSGAARVLEHHHSSPLWVGAIAIVLALATYAVAFAFAALHQDRAANYYFYTSLAGLQFLAGLGWLLDGTALGLAQATFALVAVAASVWSARATLAMHGLVLAVGAAVSSGLVGVAADGFVGPASGLWRAPGPGTVACLALVAAAFALVAVRRTATQTGVAHVVPLLGLAVVTIVGVAGLATHAAAAVVAGAPGASTDPGLVAATRTGVLSIGAVMLAGAALHWRLRELRWVVPVVLAACGVKILFEDFSQGRPATQFLTFAFYGSTLLVTPKLLKRRAAIAG